MVNKIKLLALAGVAVTGFSASAALAQAEKVDQIIGVERENMQIAQQSQQQVDKLSDQAQDLLDKFRTVARQIDDTRIYNAQLSKQIESQEAEIKQLDESIADVAIIRRQVTPLMLEMIDTLDKFIKADIPFDREARLSHVQELRDFMDRGNLSAAEQFRQILTTYQNENTYGRSVDASTGTVTRDGQEKQVEFLRIGRIFYGYRTQGQNAQAAFWDKTANGGQGGWQDLDADAARVIENGLRFAKKQANPSLLMLPVSAPEAE